MTRRLAGALTTTSVFALLLLLVADPAHALTIRGAVLGALTDELTAGKAIVLGVVEGVTEFLPISSTGHLLIVERILDVGQTDATKDAADSYTIAIQAGAILAVLGLYRHRVATMAEGVFGRSAVGRRVLIAVVVAFLPAAVIGLLLEGPIKDELLRPWPVVIAWFFGGVIVLLLVRSGALRPSGGTALDEIGWRTALAIGGFQVLAMWPGTSRSLVTIVAAILLGLSVEAAVEFSFLLGVLTLGAATGYEALKNGQLMIDTYGWIDPLVGLIAAFVSAVIAVRWLVGYLTKHDLAIFGWYRIAVAVLVAVLLLTNAI